MTEAHKQQRDRIYAANLLTRAGLAFDARDIALVAKVLPILEGDVADWTGRWISGVYVGDRRREAGIRAGRHRPPYDIRDDGGKILSRHNGDGSLRGEAGNV